MNNNAPALLRSLIIYAICVTVAIWVGCLLASETETSTGGNWAWSLLGLFQSNPVAWCALALVLCAPVLLRWHHFLLIALWNLGLMLFFVPGSPFIWMPMVCLSLGISILQRALNKNARFIPAASIIWPLICLAAVVLFTAKMTGGIGLHSLGSEVAGGKKYFTLLVAILGYFALTARPIPPRHAKLYVALFLLAGCTSVIGDLVGILPSSFYFIYEFFPVNSYFSNEVGSLSVTRFEGLGGASVALFAFMLARYGVRGVFALNKPWRLVLFFLFAVCVLFGGFRLLVVTCVAIFLVQFFLERMYQTRLFPLFIFVGIILAVLCISFANKLPYTFQRSLAFLPLKIDPVARADAEGSSEWRIEMWKTVLPEVPSHLLLGTGYALSQEDLETMGRSFYRTDTSEASAVASDYHNGPLSVILPFGIWGVLGFLWFLAASGYALYQNFRHGDPSLQTVNTFLFSFFIAHAVIFFAVFGGLNSDMQLFVGIIGLSISLNGGIQRRMTKPVPAASEPQTSAPARRRFQPYFQR